MLTNTSKGPSQNRSTRRQVKKRQEKKAAGVFAGTATWEDVKAAKAARAAAAKLEAENGGEVASEASQLAGGLSNGGDGGSGNGGSHETLPPHLIAPPHISTSPRLKGSHTFTTSYFTAPVNTFSATATATPVKSDPLESSPATTAELPPVAPPAQPSYEDLLLQAQQYRQGLEVETEKHNKLRQKYKQAEKNLKTLQVKYDEVYDQNLAFRKSAQDQYEKQGELTLETSSSDPNDLKTRLEEAAVKISHLEIRYATVAEFLEESRADHKETIEESAAKLTAKQEEIQQLEEALSSTSAERNTARENSSRLHDQLVEARGVWNAEYERLSSQNISLERELAQNAAAYEDQKQLVVHAQNLLIAEREQSRVFENALAHEQEKTGSLQKWFDQSKTALQEAQEQLSTEQKKFFQSQAGWRAQLQAQQEELEGRIQSLQIDSGEAAQLRDRCNQLEQTMESLTDQQGKEQGLLKEQIVQLLDELRHTREDAKAITAQRDEELGELNQQLSQQEVELEGLRVREREWQASEDIREELRSDAEEQVRRLKTSLEEDIRNLEKENDGHKEQMTQMEQELRVRDAKIAALNNERAMLLREKGLDDREKSELKKEIAAAEATASRQEKVVARLKSELADSRDEMRGAQSQLRDVGTVIHDLKQKVSSLERRTEKDCETDKASSDAIKPEQSLVQPPPADPEMDNQEDELESAERIDAALGHTARNLRGLVAKPGAKPDDNGDDRDTILSDLLDSQDPWLRSFRDRYGLDKARTTTAGHPDEATMTYSLLGGHLHLSDDDIVRRHNRKHPAALFRASEDSARFLELQRKVKDGQLDNEAKIELDDLMDKQCLGMKQVYRLSRISGGGNRPIKTITKEVTTEPVIIEKTVYIQNPVDAPKIGSRTKWWHAYPPIYMLIIALCLLLLGFLMFKDDQPSRQKPWERNLPLPWRFLMFINGGFPPRWALRMQYWVATRFEQPMPFY